MELYTRHMQSLRSLEATCRQACAYLYVDLAFMQSHAAFTAIQDLSTLCCFQDITLDMLVQVKGMQVKCSTSKQRGGGSVGRQELPKYELHIAKKSLLKNEISLNRRI